MGREALINRVALARFSVASTSERLLHHTYGGRAPCPVLIGKHKVMFVHLQRGGQLALT